MANLRDRRYTEAQFRRDFPDDAACLEWLRNRLYPQGISCVKCRAVTKHHRVRARRSYSCDRCGHHVHPAAGTIFERSRTPLRVWFHAIYLTASSPRGISARRLQKEIGVTYKTAWRMLRQIRRLLTGGSAPKRSGAGGTVKGEPTVRRQAAAVTFAATAKSSRANWQRWKSAIRAVYHPISSKYRRAYLAEYAFRQNHRHRPRPMFRIFLKQLGYAR